MPNSTTNPPVEIAIAPFTVATPFCGHPVPASSSVTAYAYYMSRVFAAGSFVTSGVKYLSGSASAKVRAVLCDAGGTVLASSALVPTLNGGTAGEKTLAWTTPYAVTGPTTLFIGLQSESTTNVLSTYTVAAATITGFLGGISPDTAGSSYALPASGVISIPTAYVVSTAPVVSLY